MASDKPVITIYHNKQSSVDFKAKWWNEADDRQFESITAIVKHINNTQVYRNTAFLRHARMYHNLELLGFNPSTHTRIQEYPIVNNRVTFNVVKSCIDTVQSKIAKQKPKPLFLTEDGDWSLQRKAKLLTQYVEGLFYQMDVYKTGKMAFRDGEIFGTGIIKLYPLNGKVECERVLPAELRVDDAEGMYGFPRQMHQVKYINRDVLRDMFPDKKLEQAISSATTADKQIMSFYQVADIVEVIESWHLKSGPEAKDGRHTICIENATLFSESYEKDYFPFVFIRWTDRIVGFWGQGLAEELLGIQIEINKLLRLVQMAMHLISNPRVLVENSTKVNLQHINNEIAGIIKYTGKAPDFITPTAVNPEVYQHIENLYHKAYEISGVSQLSANSQKPQGLDSGKALREFSDIESDRFQIIGQAYEQMYMDIAKIAIDITADLDKDKETRQAIKSVNGRFLKKIKWSEVNLDDSCYSMKVFPTAALSSTPSGKLSDVTNLVQSGFIDKDMAMSLLDFPDLDAYTTLANANIEITKKMITTMVETGKYETPEPEMNLQISKQMAQQAYLKYRNEGLEEDRLELLRRFVQDCNDALNPPAPPQAPAAMPGPAGAGAPQEGMSPIAVPQAPPTSNLLPIQPGGQ